MASALIIAEHRSGKLKKVTLELSSALSQAGVDTHVALFGEGLDDAAKEIAEHGAAKVHQVKDGNLTNYSAGSYASATLSLVESLNPQFVLAAHTPTGREFLPLVAAKLDAPYASDLTQVEISGDSIKARKPLYAGKATASVEFLGNGPKVFTVRPNTFGAPKASGSAGEVVNATVNLAEAKSKFLELVEGALSRPDVTEASVVVSGGRSLKNAENFKIIEDLADQLGAAVGASRAAVDAGYRPHRDQVGQTGKVVSPSLYIACGISGAIQHLAGMRTSKTIVAINTDPEAPIFQIADLGIVGDLFEIVPLLTEEAKKLKANT